MLEVLGNSDNENYQDIHVKRSQMVETITVVVRSHKI